MKTGLANPSPSTLAADSAARYVKLAAANESELARISRERLLSLSVEEMRAVQTWFAAAGREPTDAELETIAQTWSEHCKHKTFKGIVEYTLHDENGAPHGQIYDDLLDETIVRATCEVDRKFCLSVFEDNAGIIAFDKKRAAAFKVETHNHPSALEP